MPVALTVIQMVWIIQGKREEQLADQRVRIANIPSAFAAFEKGLAEGGYKGAQLAIADLWAARYERAGGVPKAGAVPVMPALVALRYLDGRDYDRAMDWLEKAYEVRAPGLPYDIASPLYDPLRSDPRFQDPARKVNLPAGVAK